jgi:hypothetical protein
LRNLFEIPANFFETAGLERPNALATLSPALHDSGGVQRV